MDKEARKLAMFTVDSFTDLPFSGNPAAVCLDDTDSGMSEKDLQNLAMEMNISETAFLRCKEGGTFQKGRRYDLRWFTPTREVPLCGHGTLAASAVLFYCLENDCNELVFDTLSGPLTATRKDKLISLDLPLNLPAPCKDLDHFKPLLELVRPENTPAIQDVQYCSVTRKLLVRLSDGTSRTELEGLRPLVDEFVAVHPHGDLSGVMVTVRADPARGGVSHKGRPYHFISRYFAPWNGIREDPVTGSAHTVLAAYWSKELGGLTTLFARQCSARGGDLELTLKSDGRLGVAGSATVVLRGQVTI